LWHDDGVGYVLAQVNIGRLRAPLDSPVLADFVAALDPVNAATPYAFTLREHFPPPSAAGQGSRSGPAEWMCPA
jgi:hypothetical protein